MAATLDSVLNQLKENNRSQLDTTGAVTKTNSLLSSWIETQKSNRLKDLEAQREAMKKMGAGFAASYGGSAKPDDKKPGGGGMPNWMKALGGGLGLAALASIIPKLLTRLGFLTAGIAAVAAAALGFRGWEVKALEKLKGLPTLLSTKVATLLDDIVRGGLKFLGVDDKLKGADGKKIQNRVNGKFAPGFQLKTTKDMLTSLFGAADDAKVGKEAGGMFAKMREIVTKLFQPVSKFISGAASAGAAFAAKFKGVFSALGISGFAGLVASPIGKFASLFSKFLAPLGFLFAGFKAVDEWINGNPERSTGKKITDSIAAFIGNFVGAPLDLLKMGVSWLFQKAFGLEVDKDGKVVGDSLAGDMLTAMREFSFEDFIKNTLKGIVSFVTLAVKEVWEFVKDPAAYVKEAYADFLSRNNASSMGDLIKNKVNGMIDALLGWIPSFEDMKAGIFNMARNILPENMHWLVPGLTSYVENLVDPGFKNELNRAAETEGARKNFLQTMMNIENQAGDGKIGMSASEMAAFGDVVLRKGKLVALEGADIRSTSVMGQLAPHLKAMNPNSEMSGSDMVAAVVGAMNSKGGGNVMQVNNGGDTTTFAIGGGDVANDGNGTMLLGNILN